MPKVFMPTLDALTKRMFNNRGWGVTYSLSKADLVQFVGGEDVNPQLYEQPPHEETYFNPERDRKEATYFFLAQMNKIPMAGICRGAQFLHVMCGGKLFQHVNNHTFNHKVKHCFYNQEFEVNSTHHQMIDMCGVNHGTSFVMLEAHESTKKEYMTNMGKVTYMKPHEDIEAVWHSDFNVLCFQPHPEYEDAPKGLEDIYFDMLEETILVKGS